MSVADRNVRNLAGYGDTYNRTRVEIDVWAVNGVERDRDLPDPEDLPGNVAEVLAVAGNVAKVRYSGAAGVGYQYLDPSRTNDPEDGPFDATQQAFAGAARAGASPRTGRGTFGEGGGSAVAGPNLGDVVERAEDEVLPTARAELAGLGVNLDLEQERVEDAEQVADPTTSGTVNVVRVKDRGKWYRYEVEDGALRPTGRRAPVGPP